MAEFCEQSSPCPDSYRDSVPSVTPWLKFSTTETQRAQRCTEYAMQLPWMIDCYLRPPCFMGLPHLCVLRVFFANFASLCMLSVFLRVLSASVVKFFCHVECTEATGSLWTKATKTSRHKVDSV